MAPRLIALGVVARPHGVRGEVRVHRFNPASTLLLEREQLWLRQADLRRVRVRSSRAQGDAVVLTLEGVDDRDAADALRGAELCVAREELPELAADEVYHADLIGMAVVTEDGAPQGRVEEVIAYPTIDCLLVRGPSGDREVPFIEPYVVSIERDSIVVAHLEDLERSGS